MKKTAWFMMRRLREAMSDIKPGSMGTLGAAVQADETYHRSGTRNGR